jgi:hypothetical protein
MVTEVAPDDVHDSVVLDPWLIVVGVAVTVMVGFEPSAFTVEVNWLEPPPPPPQPINRTETRLTKGRSLKDMLGLHQRH